MEIAVLVSVGILLTVLGGVLGVALGRYVWPAIRDSYTAALLTAQMQATKFEEDCRSLRKQTEQLEAERGARIEELREAGQDAARLGERVESLKSQVEEQVKLVRLLEGQRDAAAADVRAASGEVARLYRPGHPLCAQPLGRAGALPR